MSLSLPDPFARDAIALYGLPFDSGGLHDVAAKITTAARRRERLWLSTVNLDWLLLAGEDPGFKRSILASDLVTMDGAPVVRLAQLAGVADAQKVAGSDLFDRLRGEDLSVFFFGGRQGAAERATARLAAGDQTIRAAGHHNPGFGSVAEMSAPDMLAPIEEASPDMLIASLSALKGQAWLLQNGDRLTVPVRAHLGAVVDFVAGTIDRAPEAWQRSGLEWVWRIRQEPSLWRRYAKDATLLPGLVRDALAARRLIGALAKSGATESTAMIGETEGRTTLTLGGRIDDAALKDALRRALSRQRALQVTLAKGAAPGLRTMGSLLLARAAFMAKGFGYEVCFSDPRAARLARITLGETPLASSTGTARLDSSRASGGRM